MKLCLIIFNEGKVNFKEELWERLGISKKRMNDRCIPRNLVDLTLAFGIKTKDGKVILNKEGLEELLEQLKKMEQTAQTALNKGGIVLVCDEEALVRTYTINSYRRTNKKKDSLRG